MLYVYSVLPVACFSFGSENHVIWPTVSLIDLKFHTQVQLKALSKKDSWTIEVWHYGLHLQMIRLVRPIQNLKIEFTIVENEENKHIFTIDELEQYINFLSID